MPAQTGRSEPPSTMKKNARETPPVAYLSCEGCSSRKIKCDRVYPCQACRNAGRPCVAVVRPRLPRGRSGGRKKGPASGLKDRLNRLEELVSTLRSVNGSTSPVVTETQPQQRPAVEPPRPPPAPVQAAPTSPNFATRLGGSLWQSLSTEIAELRMVFDEDEDAGRSPQGASASPSSDASAPTNLLSIEPRPGGFVFPLITAATVGVFSNIFTSSIDPPTKFIYAPVFKNHLEYGAPYFDYHYDSIALLALKSAVFYACTCSVSEQQCLQWLGAPKREMRALWQRTTEAAMSEANLIDTEDTTVLSAFLIYLLALRSHESGRKVWTLAATAVRIGIAVNLHNEMALSSLSPFEAEMRRRLWYAILQLDMQYAADRGTSPIIEAGSWTTKPPLNINDRDLPPDCTTRPASRSGFTDMTLAYGCSVGEKATRLCNFVPLAQLNDKSSPAVHWDWSVRIAILDEMHADMAQVLPPDFIPADQIELHAKRVFAVVKCIASLVVYRPLQRHTALPPPPLLGQTILEMSCEAIEALISLESVETSIPNRGSWAKTGFVPWHPLAVLLAELCLDQEGAGEQLLERAWKVADRAFVYMTSNVADGLNGPLWHPLVKLMRRAQAKHEERRGGMMQAERGGSVVGLADAMQAGEAHMGPPPVDMADLSLQAPSTLSAAFPASAYSASAFGSGWPASAAAGGGLPQQDSWDQWFTVMDDMMGNGTQPAVYAPRMVYPFQQ